MLTNKSDITRVAQSKYQPSYKEIQDIEKKTKQFLLKQNPETISDADKVKLASNLQDASNANFFGFLLSQPRQIDPSTVAGQKAIKANVDYTFRNIQNFAEQLALAGVAEAINYLTAFREIGSGAEQIVKSRILSPNVHKVGTVDRAEHIVRNMTPGSVKSKYVGETVDGLTMTKQKKVRTNISPEREEELLNKLDKLLKSDGWKEFTHPEYNGRAYTKNNRVIFDLEGNIGETYLTRKPALYDHGNMSLDEFKMAFNKQGGKLIEMRNKWLNIKFDEVFSIR